MCPPPPHPPNPHHLQEVFENLSDCFDCVPGWEWEGKYDEEERYEGSLIGKKIIWWQQIIFYSSKLSRAEKKMLRQVPMFPCFDHFAENL